MKLIRFDFFPLLRVSQYFINTFPGRPDIFNVRDEKLHRLRWNRNVLDETAWWFQQLMRVHFRKPNIFNVILKAVLK